MRMGFPAHHESSTLRTHGRRRPARRLLPVRDCAFRRCASAWQPSAPLHAGIDARSAPSDVQFHDRSHFDRAIDFQDRAAFGERYSMLQITGLNQRITTDDVLGFSKRSVRHGLLFAVNQLAGALERLSLVFDVTILTELLKPGHPLLHRLLHPFGGPSSFASAIKKYVLAHC